MIMYKIETTQFNKEISWMFTIIKLLVNHAKIYMDYNLILKLVISAQKLIVRLVNLMLKTTKNVMGVFNQ